MVLKSRGWIQKCIAVFMIIVILTPNVYCVEMSESSDSETTETSQVDSEDTTEEDTTTSTEEESTSIESTNDEELLSDTVVTLSSSSAPTEDPLIVIEGATNYLNPSFENSMDSFDTSLFTGSFIYTYQIETVRGRAGLEPKVSLSYSSSKGSKGTYGSLGMGWSLNENCIIRDVRYTLDNVSDDRFILILDGSTYELVYVEEDDSYHTEVESFLLITKNTTSTNSHGDFWIIKDADGTSYRFGYTNVSEQTNSVESRNYVSKWWLDRTKDVNGNQIVYNYVENPRSGEIGSTYLDNISYNNNAAFIDISYVEKPNTFSLYEQGNFIREKSQISNITIINNESILWTYNLEYESKNSKSFLADISKTGMNNQSFPSTSFDYDTLGVWGPTNTWNPPDDKAFSNSGRDIGLRLADLNGDGLADLIKSYNSGAKAVWLNNGNGWEGTGSWNPPTYFSYEGNDAGVRFTDLNGDGLVDLIQRYRDGSGETNNAWLNTGSGWEDAPGYWNSPTIISYRGMDYGVRFADLNGDGLVDIIQGYDGGRTGDKYCAWLNNGNGWENAPSSWIPPEEFSYRGEDKGLRLADLNGDGLVDLIQGYDADGSDNDKYCAWLNTGSGWSSTSSWNPLTPFIDDGEDKGLRLADANGDGLVDLVQGYKKNSYTEYNTWLNTGNGWSCGSNPPTFFSYGGTTDRGVRFADLNGDGLVDLVQGYDTTGTSGDEYHSWINTNGGANPPYVDYNTPCLMRGIHHSTGANTTVNYVPSTTFDNTGNDSVSDLPLNVWVTSQIIRDNGIEGTGNLVSSTNYSYKDGMQFYDAPEEIEFRGFGEVTVENNYSITKHTFHQDDILKGIENHTEVWDTNGNLYSTADKEYITQELYSDVNLILLENESSTQFDGLAQNLNDSIGWSSYTEYDEYDDYGNPLSVTEYGDMDIAGDERYLHYEYVNDEEDWILGKTVHQWLEGHDHINMSESWYFYDDTEDNSDLDRGLLTKVVSWNNNGYNPSIQYDYDTYGNIVEIADAKGFSQTIEYDEDHVYPVSIENSLGQKESYEYNDVGRITKITDINGVSTDYVYDDLHRISKVIKPYDDASLPSIEYTYEQDGVAPEQILTRLKDDIKSSCFNLTFTSQVQLLSQTSTLLSQTSTLPYWIEGVDSDDRTFMKIDELGPSETKVYAVYKEEGYEPNGSDVFVQYHGPATSSYLDSLSVNPNSVIYESKIKVNGDANIWFGLADTQADGLSNGLTIKPNPQTATYSRNYIFAWNTGNPTVLYTAAGGGSTVVDTYYNLKIECNGSSAKYYLDDAQLLSTITTNIPTTNLGLGANTYSGSFTQDWAFARKYEPLKPTVTVEDMGSWYQIYVTNNADETLTDYQIAILSTDLNLNSTSESLYTELIDSYYSEYIPVSYWIEGVDNNDRLFMIIDEMAPLETQTYALYKQDGYEPNGSDVFVQYHRPATSSYLDSLSVDPSSVIYESKVKVNGDANIWFGLADTQADGLSNGLTIKPNPQTATYSRNYIFAWNTGNPTVLYTAAGVASTVVDTYYNLKIECNGSSAKYYIDDTQLLSTITTNIPTTNLGLGANTYSGSFTQDWAFARKYEPVIPTVTVEDMGTWYQINITNNVFETLTDYQVAVSTSDLNLSLTEESLRIVQLDLNEKLYTNNGFVSIDSYDGFGQLILKGYEGESNCISQITTYNELGLVSSTEVPHYINESGQFITYQYDPIGRPTVITITDNTTLRYQYELENTTITNQNGVNKTLTSDIFGNIVKVYEFNEGDTYVTSYSYDAMNNLVEIIPSTPVTPGTALPPHVYFTYDSLGRKISMNDPDMGNWTYEYDLNGNLINQTDARGVSTLLSYDALDRLTAIDYPSDDDVSFTYDLGLNGTLSQVSRGGISSAYDYDQRYRVDNETVTLDGTDYTTSYQYDSMDRPTSITYPDGNSVNLRYNAQTLLESVEGVVDNLDYNARNQITTKELSNGVNTSYTYDSEKLLLDRIYTESLQDLNYDFDNVGNILEIEDNVLNSVKTYGYDDLDRLTSADMSVNSVPTYLRDFTYDQYGCIRQVTDNGITISSYEYSLAPFHAPVTYNNESLDYDDNGNLIEDEDFIYVYNDANQLSEVRYSSNSSLVEKYWYDANGQRVKKQNSAGEFTYYVNQFYEIENGTATSYFFRDDERIAKETSGDMEWYLSDHLGSTTLLINESGLEIERTEYYPYGEVQSGGLEKYGFTGQENDADTGLMNYGARYYSPEYRVFVQPDTMLPDVYNPQYLNRYAYCLDNPVKYNDPSGHYIETGLDLAFLAMDLNDIRTGNADKWTYIGLGADAVCLLLPGATGGRLAVKAVEEGVTHADNVGDLFKFLDKTTEAASATNKADNLYDVAKSTEGLADGITIVKKPSPIPGDNIRRTLNYDGKNIQINTGHGYRSDHPAGGDVTGFGSINEIESEIVLDVNSAVNSGINIPTNTAIERTVSVNGNNVGYTLMQLNDGTYSVSTYYPKI